jgi:hypothetical protein
MAIFLCDECGEPAATVYFVPPFVEDPRVDHGSGHEDPGAGSIELRAPRISIAGGPVPVTISAAGDWADAAATALRRRDAKMLSEIDREFAPFWCHPLRTVLLQEPLADVDELRRGILRLRRGSLSEGTQTGPHGLDAVPTH